MQKAREENAELRKRLNEVSSLETAKRKADTRVEQLEQKVCSLFQISLAYCSSCAIVPNQMDELIQEKVTQKENELNATYDEKMRNYEERYVFMRVESHTVGYTNSQRARSPAPAFPDEEPAPRPPHVT